MSGEDDIVRAKLNLQNALGDHFSDYMRSMRKWFAGKTSKQEFDKEAREIVTDNFVHLHNEFLLCIINKCNNFTSTSNEASTKTIFPILPCKNSTKTTTTTAKKKPKTNEPLNKYNLRFVPVDPIKHAPSIVAASLETASLASQDFTLEFCAREKSLPYAKMIHNRMLLTAIDHNIQQVDINAVFMLAEATIWVLKNIIEKLVSRSKFKDRLRTDFLFEKYKTSGLISQKCINDYENNVNTFNIDENLINNLDNPSKKDDEYESEMEIEENDSVELKQITDDLNRIKPRKLEINLYDLKNLLQSDKSLMPSHSVYTMNMERIICNMWHHNEEST